jgi:hypothetical protein
MTRISTTSVVASSSTVLASALVLLLGASATFADGIDHDVDLPVEAPVLGQPVQTQAPPPPSAPPITTTPPPIFFGHDIPSTGSIVYVIDQSGSMSLTVPSFTDQNNNIVTGGCRMDRAKAELVKSIATLPKTFVFNVIFYDECVRPWKPQSVTASDSNKQAAFAYIAGQGPMGFTNTGLAVATALQDKSNRSVVLLSDGEPNFLDCACNYVGTYDEHEQLIKSNNNQGARIDCFGIGVSGDADARNFMIAVASQNSGTYVQVD